jgi:hypothetical protein
MLRMINKLFSRKNVSFPFTQKINQRSIVSLKDGRTFFLRLNVKKAVNFGSYKMRDVCIRGR